MCFTPPDKVEEAVRVLRTRSSTHEAKSHAIEELAKSENLPKWDRFLALLFDLMGEGQFHQNIILICYRLRGDAKAMVQFKKDNKLLDLLARFFPAESWVGFVDMLWLLDTLTTGLIIGVRPPWLRLLLSHVMRTVLSLQNRPDRLHYNIAFRILLNLVDSTPLSVLEIYDAQEREAIWGLAYPHVELILKDEGHTDGWSDDQWVALINSAHFILAAEMKNNQSLFHIALTAAKVIAKRLVDPECDEEEWRAAVCFFKALLKRYEEVQFLLNAVPPTNMPENNVRARLATFQSEFVTMAKFTVSGLKTLDFTKIIGPQRVAPLLLDIIQSIVTNKTVIEALDFETKQNLYGVLSFFETSYGTENVAICSQVYECLHSLWSSMDSLHGAEMANLREDVVSCLQRIKIVTDTSADDVRYNTACVRLWGFAQTLHCQPLLNMVVLDLITKEKEALCQFINKLLATADTEESNEAFEDFKVWCVVEVFGILADNSQNKLVMEALVAAMNTEGGAGFLAKAIRSQNRSIVARTLYIVSNVGYKRDNINTLATALCRMNSGLDSCSTFAFACRTFQSVPCPTPSYGTVDQAIKAIQTDTSSGRDPFISDVVAMYDAQTQFYNCQLFFMKAQAEGAEKLNGELQKLLDKQAQVLGSFGAQIQMKDRQIRQLMEEVESLYKMNEDLSYSVKQKFKTIHHQTVFMKKKAQLQSKLIDDLKVKLRGMDAERKELMKTCEREKTLHVKNKADFEGKLKEKDEEKQSLESKMMKLESDYVETQDEIRRLEFLLAKEKQTVDVIRGLLHPGSA